MSLLIEDVLRLIPSYCDSLTQVILSLTSNMFRSLLERKAKEDKDYLCMNALVGQHYDLLKWLRKNGCPWGVLDLGMFILRGTSEELVEWARADRCPDIGLDMNNSWLRTYGLMRVLRTPIILPIVPTFTHSLIDTTSVLMLSTAPIDSDLSGKFTRSDMIKEFNLKPTLTSKHSRVVNKRQAYAKTFKYPTDKRVRYR